MSSTITRSKAIGIASKEISGYNGTDTPFIDEVMNAGPVERRYLVPKDCAEEGKEYSDSDDRVLAPPDKVRWDEVDGNIDIEEVYEPSDEYTPFVVEDAREHFEKVVGAYGFLAEGFREDPINRDVLIDNLSYAVVCGQELTAYVPLNLGMDQDIDDLCNQLTRLSSWAGRFQEETGIDFNFACYALDPYSELNGNGDQAEERRQELKDKLNESDGFEGAEVNEWDWFRDEVLECGEEEWSRTVEEKRTQIENAWSDGRKKDFQSDAESVEGGDGITYAAMRLAESDLMSGEVRLSPGTRRDDPADLVPRVDAQFKGEAVIYGPFRGSWKSDFNKVEDAPEAVSG